MNVVNEKNNNKVSKVLSTKLSIEDYKSFVMLTKIEYEPGLIKEESTPELSEENALMVCNYIQPMKTEIMPSKQYKQSIIEALCHLDRFP